MREYVGRRPRDASGARTRRQARSSPAASASWATSRAPTCRSTSPRCRPKMLRLAGEIADGVMLWLCNPDYIRDVVVPEVASGPRARRQDARGLRHRRGGAGRRHRRQAVCLRDDAKRPDHLLEPPVLPGDDRALGLRRRHRRVRRGHRGGRRRGAPRRRCRTASSATSPRSDRPDEVRAGIKRYADSGATSPGSVAVPRTDFEATLEAAKPAQSG